MRGLRSTIALFLVLVGLGAYIYFVTSKKTETTAAKKDPVFSGVETDKLEEVKVKSAPAATSRRSGRPPTSGRSSSRSRRPRPTPRS